MAKVLLCHITIDDGDPGMVVTEFNMAKHQKLIRRMGRLRELAEKYLGIRRNDCSGWKLLKPFYCRVMDISPHTVQVTAALYKWVDDQDWLDSVHSEALFLAYLVRHEIVR